MEKLVLKQYSRLKISDLLSVVLGFIGLTGGILSIVALSEQTWYGNRENHEKWSSIFTVVSLIFDTLSTFMAIQAFLISRIIKDIKKTNNVYIRKREIIGEKLDMSGFIVGVIGLIAGWISLIALQQFWGSDRASVAATIVCVFFDLLGCTLVIGAIAVIESIHNKYFTNEATRGVKTRISRRRRNIK